MIPLNFNFFFFNTFQIIYFIVTIFIFNIFKGSLFLDISIMKLIFYFYFLFFLNDKFIIFLFYYIWVKGSSSDVRGHIQVT